MLHKYTKHSISLSPHPIQDINNIIIIYLSPHQLLPFFTTNTKLHYDARHYCLHIKDANYIFNHFPNMIITGIHLNELYIDEPSISLTIFISKLIHISQTYNRTNTNSYLTPYNHNHITSFTITNPCTENIETLSLFPKLNSLTLNHYGPYLDLDALKMIHNLHTLKLLFESEGIIFEYDIYDILKCKQLKYLKLVGSFTNNNMFISHQNLQIFKYIATNCETNTIFFTNCPNLKTIKISNSPLSHINLATTPNLHNFKLSNCPNLQNISGLTQCKKLTKQLPTYIPSTII